MTDARTARTAEAVRALAARLEADDFDPRQEELERRLAAIAADDPERGELVNAAAIPRWIDAGVVGVLRDRPDDDAGNAEALDFLASLPWMRRRSDGSLAMQYDARQQLLRQWREEGGHRSAFHAYSRQLADHHWRSADAMSRARDDLARVGELLREAAPELLAVLRRRVEELETRPTLEGLYHEILTHPADGLQRFRRRFEAAESEGSLTLCRAMIEAAGEYLQAALGDEDPDELMGWWRYYRARLDRALGRQSRPSKELHELLDGARDPQLRAWALGELVEIHHEWDAYDRALPLIEEQLRLKAEVDRWNLAYAWLQLGTNRGLRGDLEGQVEALRQAIAAARDIGNIQQETAAGLSLAAALHQLGRGDDAREAGVRALDRRRTVSLPSRSELFDALHGLVGLVALEPEVLDAIHAELYEITDTSAGFDAAGMGLARDMADALRRSGRIARARAVLASARAAYEREHVRGLSSLPLDLADALLLSDEGEHAATIDSYTRLLDEPRRPRLTPWQRGMSLSNRGLAFRSLGQWERALEDFRDARDIWADMGQTRLKATLRVFEAVTWLRRYRADRMASGSETADSLERRIERADLDRLTGHRGEARDAYKSTLAAARDARHGSAMARCHLALAVLDAESADWAGSSARLAEALAAELGGGLDLEPGHGHRVPLPAGPEDAVRGAADDRE